MTAHAALDEALAIHPLYPQVLAYLGFDMRLLRPLASLATFVRP